MTSQSTLFTSGLSEQTVPISKAKANQLSHQEIQTIKSRDSTPNWQSAGDDGVYVNTHFAAFHTMDIAPATLDDVKLERNIQPNLKTLTYTKGDGSTSQPLQDFCHDDYNRNCALVMAHKGKIVFEEYNGMHPNQSHIWFSTSKTTVGAILLLLEADGMIDLEKNVPDYAPDLKGTAWDNVPIKHCLNMAAALDLEETTAAFLDPNSWIEQFFDSLFTTDKSKSWIEMLKKVQPMPNLKPGERMQYSTAVTQALVLVCEHASKVQWIDLFNNYIWSKLHVRGDFKVGLSSIGEAVAGGLNYTTPEDMIKYAMVYLPGSYSTVADERVISADILKKMQTFGPAEAYQGGTEWGYSKQWFGEHAERNSCQWDAVFSDGAMFKHGNMHQGIYVDPDRDFCAMYFSSCPNDRPDFTPGYLREAAKQLAGK